MGHEWHFFMTSKDEISFFSFELLVSGDHAHSHFLPKINRLNTEKSLMYKQNEGRKIKSSNGRHREGKGNYNFMYDYVTAASENSK